MNKYQRQRSKRLKKLNKLDVSQYQIKGMLKTCKDNLWLVDMIIKELEFINKI
jgi:hypothetical protein